ncbi:tRNA pseudouridine(55) synthase TruB [Candidatus Saccharibacteria bacterium]|nr:tRNA pseudouridine(55) synthase TruB [Candidatus Saccharibacteria bacterium]
MNDGFILIDKPAGMTSFGVVARVRRVLSKQQGKKVKVGHTGTLDPFATGLMILVVGKECKNAAHYTKLDKTYEATFKLGQTSTTGDIEGELSQISSRVPTIDEIKNVLARFVGEIKQTPPIYSAISINGQRAYDLARAGKEVNIPERLVKIHNLDLVDYTYPNLKISTHVSSGTYIRSLAEDIGKALGVGAYCTELRRTTIDNYNLKSALKLVQLGIDD